MCTEPDALQPSRTASLHTSPSISPRPQLCVLLGVRDLVPLEIRTGVAASTKEEGEEAAAGAATEECRTQTEARDERVDEDRD